MLLLAVTVFVALLFLAGVLLGSSLAVFIDVPSLLLVLGACLIPCGAFGRQALLPLRWRALDEGEREQARRVLEAWDRSAFAGAGLAVGIAAMQMMMSFTGVESLAWIAPAAMVTLLPLVYAMALRVFLWLPLGLRLERAV